MFAHLCFVNSGLIKYNGPYLLINMHRFLLCIALGKALFYQSRSVSPSMRMIICTGPPYRDVVRLSEICV